MVKFVTGMLEASLDEYAQESAADLKKRTHETQP